MSPWLSDALLRSQSDERLVALAREGRERAFTLLVERHRRPLLVLAHREVGEGRAEDAVQQGLLQAWSALARGARVEHPRAWLHQIVRHAAWKGAAGADADAEPLDPEWAGGRTADAEVEGRLDLDALLVGMAALPERQRAAIVQTEWEGRSREEIAGSLGLSEGAVRQLVHRARSSLRTAVTVLTPTPLAAWAARSMGNDGLVSRLGDVLAPAAGTGALVKISTVVIASGAVATGVSEVRDHGATQRPDPRAAAVTTTRSGDLSERSSLAPATPATALRTTAFPSRRTAKAEGGRRRTGVAGGGQLIPSHESPSGQIGPGGKGHSSGPGPDGSGPRDGGPGDGRGGTRVGAPGPGPGGDGPSLGLPDGGERSGPGPSGPGPSGPGPGSGGPVPPQPDSRDGGGGPRPVGLGGRPPRRGTLGVILGPGPPAGGGDDDGY